MDASILRLASLKFSAMIKEAVSHIDDETIRHLSLQPADIPQVSQLATNARVYAIPALENVFVMESDFYGNPMPEGSCFLAFQGKRGLMGRHISVDKLRNCSIGDLQRMVDSGIEG
jgi:hypothetical protein